MPELPGRVMSGSSASAATERYPSARSRLDRLDRQLAVQGFAGRVALPGPGASLPSAPVFAVDAVVGAGSRRPQRRAAGPSPSLTPGASGVPGPGAAAGRRRRSTRYEPLDDARSADARTSRSAIGREGNLRPVCAGVAVSVASVSDFPIGIRSPFCQRSRPGVVAEHARRRHVGHSVFRRSAFPMADPERVCRPAPVNAPSRSCGNASSRVSPGYWPRRHPGRLPSVLSPSSR